MFSDSLLPEPKLIQEIEASPEMIEVSQKDNIYFNDCFTTIRLIRRFIYNMLLRARYNLPKNYYFMIYEAYRPLASQKALWDEIVIKQSAQNPNMNIDSEDFISLCDKFVANPYRQGSGHQSGAAIDVSLVDSTGKEYDMGGGVRRFDNTAEYNCKTLSAEAEKNRLILKNALEDVGFVNYPSEWWHYSFGDRLWAKLTGSKIAIFGKLDL